MKKITLIILTLYSVFSHGQNDSLELKDLIKEYKFTCSFDKELLKYLDTIPSSSDSLTQCYRTEIYSTTKTDVYYQKRFDSKDRILSEGTASKWFKKRKFWFGKRGFFDWNGKCKFYSYEENKVRYANYYTSHNPGCSQTLYNVYKTEKIY